MVVNYHRVCLWSISPGNYKSKNRNDKNKYENHPISSTIDDVTLWRHIQMYNSWFLKTLGYGLTANIYIAKVIFII